MKLIHFAQIKKLMWKLFWYTQHFNFSLFPQFLFYILKLYYKRRLNSQFSHWSCRAEINQRTDHIRRKSEPDLLQNGDSTRDKAKHFITAQVSWMHLYKCPFAHSDFLKIYCIMILHIHYRNVKVISTWIYVANS